MLRETSVYRLVLWSMTLLMVADCATVNEQRALRTEDLLIAAGFTTKVPTTPEGKAKFEALTPRKMVKGTKEGKAVYVYPDPEKCGCAYVGGEEQYAAYRSLALQQRIAEESIVESMDDPLAEWD